MPDAGVLFVGVPMVAGPPDAGSGSNNRLGSISGDEGFPGHNSVEDAYGDGGAVSAPHCLTALISGIAFALFCGSTLFSFAFAFFDHQ